MLQTRPALREESKQAQFCQNMSTRYCASAQRNSCQVSSLYISKISVACLDPELAAKHTKQRPKLSF